MWVVCFNNSEFVGYISRLRQQVVYAVILSFARFLRCNWRAEVSRRVCISSWSNQEQQVSVIWVIARIWIFSSWQLMNWSLPDGACVPSSWCTIAISWPLTFVGRRSKKLRDFWLANVNSGSIDGIRGERYRALLVVDYPSTLSRHRSVRQSHNTMHYFRWTQTDNW